MSGEFLFFQKQKDCKTEGLQNKRTAKQKDCKTEGLQNRRTAKQKDCKTEGLLGHFKNSYQEFAFATLRS